MIQPFPSLHSRHQRASIFTTFTIKRGNQKTKTKTKTKTVPVKAAAFPDYKQQFTANGGLRQLLLLPGRVVVMTNPYSP